MLSKPQRCRLPLLPRRWRCGVLSQLRQAWSQAVRPGPNRPGLDFSFLRTRWALLFPTSWASAQCVGRGRGGAGGLGQCSSVNWWIAACLCRPYLSSINVGVFLAQEDTHPGPFLQLCSVSQVLSHHGICRPCLSTLPSLPSAAAFSPPRRHRAFGHSVPSQPFSVPQRGGAMLC